MGAKAQNETTYVDVEKDGIPYSDVTLPASAADSIGWPAHYGGVMLQGFYWMSYDDTNWKNITAKCDTLSKYFDLIWVPNSAQMASNPRGMGYIAHSFFNHNTKSFGSEQELKTMINTYKKKGVGFIEDVVINHRTGADDYNIFSFAREKYKDKYYQLTSRDILNDDNGGKTKQTADILGFTLSPNGEESLPIAIGNPAVYHTEDNSAGLDLDHRSSNVRDICRTYDKFLIDDLGYVGFRYDVAKGFRPWHIAEYNAYSHPRFSVGEMWEGDSVKLHYFINNWKWKDDAGNLRHMCAAFDFSLKHQLFNPGFNAGDFSQTKNIFKNKGLLSINPLNSRYALTFVENHDTYYPRDDRSISADNALTNNVLPANAYILAMPGTPCIYLKHWLDKTMQTPIKKMILGRKAAGVTNMSRIIDDGYDPTDHDGYYAVIQGDIEVDSIAPDGTNTGKKHHPSVLLFIGDVNPTNLNGHTINEYYKVASGENYSFYISNSVKDTYLKYYKDATKDITYTDASKDNVTYDSDALANHTPSTGQTGRAHKIYVLVEKDDPAPMVHVWDTDANGQNAVDINGDWNNQKPLTKKVTVNGREWWTVTFYNSAESRTTINVILHNKNGQGATYNDVSNDLYLQWDDANHTSEDITTAIVGTTQHFYTVFVKKNPDLAAPPVIRTKIGGAYTSTEFDVADKSATFNGVDYWYDRVTTNGDDSYSVEVGSKGGTEEKPTYTRIGNEIAGLKADVYLEYTASTVDDITENIKGSGKKNYTIYVKAKDGNDKIENNTPCLHAWVDGGGNLTGEWNDEQVMTTTTVINGVTWWYRTISLNPQNKFNAKLHGLTNKSGEGGESKQFGPMAQDLYLEWDATKPSNSAEAANPLKDAEGRLKYTVYVKKASDDTQAPYLNAWDNNGSDNALNGVYNLGDWGKGTQEPNPDQLMTDTKVINGETWWYKTLTLHAGQTQYTAQLHGWKKDNDGKWQNDGQFQTSAAGHDFYLTWTPTQSPNGSDISDNYVHVVDPGGWYNWTLYVLKNEGEKQGPMLHPWGTGINGSDWVWDSDNEIMKNSITIGDSTYWYHTFTHMTDTIAFKLHEKGGPESSEFKFGGDMYLSWKSGTATDITLAVKGGGSKGTGNIDDNEDKVLEGDFVQRRYTVYFKTPDDWPTDNKVRTWAWIDNGANFTGGDWNGENATYIGTWPEEVVTTTKDEKGNETKKKEKKDFKYFAWSYVGDITDKPQKVIFSYFNGVGGGGDKTQVQTANLDFRNGMVLTNDNKATYPTAEQKRKYADLVRGVYHVIFLKDNGWKEATAKVYGDDVVTYYNDDKSKQSTDYVRIYAGSKHQLTPVTIRGEKYWVWNYGGSLRETPDKVEFFGDGQSLAGAQKYVENGLYTYDASAKTIAADETTGTELAVFNTLYQRQFTPGKRATLILPFQLTPGQLINMNLKAYSFKGVESNVVRFVREENGTKAMVPYLVVYESDNGKKENIFYRTGMSKLLWNWPVDKDNKDVRQSAQDVTLGTDGESGVWTFKGNLTPNYIKVTNGSKENTDSKAYFGYNEAKDEFIWAEKRSAYIPETVCYFETKRSYFKDSDLTFNDDKNATAAKSMQIQLYESEADVPTAISEIIVPGDANAKFDANAPMYNLAGQRVGKDYKGIVIQNGRKIIRK